MRDPTAITLGGVQYAVKPFTLSQVQRIARLRDGGSDIPFEVLKIALERADPKPAVPGEIEALPKEIAPAVDALFEANGFERTKPGEAPAPAADGRTSTAS